MEPTVAEPRNLFAALADPLRLRLACCLAAHPEGLCVCELTEALRASQPNVSQHLRLLKAAGLAADRRDGRFIYYRLRRGAPRQADPLLESVRACLVSCTCCAEVKDDLGRLRRRLKHRRGGKCVVGFRPGRKSARRAGKGGRR
jgi:ArsR family transcriptional regulator